jgi:hypothetical protein
MTVYTLPSGLVPKRQRLAISAANRIFTSPYSQQLQAVDLMSEVWRTQLDLPDDISNAMGGQLEALIDRLKGRVNKLAVGNFKRREPLGTMRGTPIVATLAAQLANTLIIQTTAGASLLAGDMLGVSGLLLRVLADAVADGSGLITVEIAPRLRVAVAAGATVIWSQPTSNFVLAADGVPIDWHPGFYAGPQLDLIEAP